jgi:hypothetical protein
MLKAEYTHVFGVIGEVRLETRSTGTKIREAEWGGVWGAVSEQYG